MMNCIFLGKHEFMLTKPELRFSFIYGLITLGHLVFGVVPSLNNFTIFSKPLILFSLLVFFILESIQVDKTKRILISAALLFSLIGDTALLFEQWDPKYFVIGLGSFLVAHIMYVFTFLKDRDRMKKPFLMIFILLAYAFGLFYFLKDGLGDLMIPVIIYMIVILAMAATAVLRRKDLGSKSFEFVFVGALLFMISDSILALDKFHNTLLFSSVSIMLTYALAQYLIVLGLLKASTKKE